MHSGRSSKRRPSGWTLHKLGGGRGPDRGVLRAPNCEEAPLLGVERALDVAEYPGTRLFTLCGAAQELTRLLRRFDRIDAATSAVWHS